MFGIPDMRIASQLLKPLPALHNAERTLPA
jgi:hypothetical protein